MEDFYERILESVNACSLEAEPAPSFVAAVASSQQQYHWLLTDERLYVSHSTGQRFLELTNGGQNLTWYSSGLLGDLVSVPVSTDVFLPVRLPTCLLVLISYSLTFRVPTDLSTLLPTYLAAWLPYVCIYVFKRRLPNV